MSAAPKTLQILVVDDDDVDREQLQRLLAHSGFDFQVTEAQDAELALDLIGKRNFDWVLLDCHLPGVDGLDLIEQLSRGSMPVLMISGREDAAAATEAIKRRQGISDEERYPRRQPATGHFSCSGKPGADTLVTIPKERPPFQRNRSPRSLSDAKFAAWLSQN